MALVRCGEQACCVIDEMCSTVANGLHRSASMTPKQTDPIVLLRSRRGGQWELRESDDGKRMVVYVTSKGRVGLIMMLPERSPTIGVA